MTGTGDTTKLQGQARDSGWYPFYQVKWVEGSRTTETGFFQGVNRAVLGQYWGVCVCVCVLAYRVPQSLPGVLGSEGKVVASMQSDV